jgi:hypothetical protein
MASYMEFIECWQKIPKAQTVMGPPCCWVIFSKDGKKLFTLDEGLPIFEEWPDVQDFIKKMKIEGGKPRLLYWHEVVEKAKKIVQEIILDIGGGAYVSFPPLL